MRASRYLVIITIVLLIGCATTESDAALITGLRNYWNFDGNLADKAHGAGGTASTVADDGAFDGLNGTGGISYGTGLFGGGSLEQDGAAGAAENNGFVRVPRSSDTLYGGTDTLTTSLWVNAAGFDTNWQTMLAHGEGEQYRIHRLSDKDVAAYAGGSGEVPGSALGPDISAGTGWHHIVAISEAGVDTRLWVDNTFIGFGAVPDIDDAGNGGAPGGVTPDLFIGANPQTGVQNREWWGQLDDIAQWDRALTDAEIMEIYDGGKRDRVSLGALVGIPEPSSAALMLLVFGLVAGLKYVVGTRRTGP